MQRTSWSPWRRFKSQAAGRARHWASVSRPNLETLETRTLLSFGSPVSYTIGTQPSPAINNVSEDGVATGDFRGTGLLDLAVVHSVEHTLNILFNNGDGTFQPAVSYSVPGVSFGPIWIAVADFNGDGNLDIATLGNTGSNDEGVVDVFLGNGDGTFRPGVAYDSGQVSRGEIAVGDFLGNGTLDLAVSDFTMLDSSHSALAIMMNNGDGTFQAPRYVPVPPAVRSVVAVDVNGDGKTDLVAADGEGYNGILNQGDPAGMTVLLSNGDGTFQNAGQYDSPATPGGGTVNPEAITAGDLNGDGIPDVIVSDYDHNLNVYLGNGDGTFQPAIGVDTGEYPRAVSIADVNGDGIPDLVVGNIGNISEPSAGSVAVLLGHGDGTFQDAIQYTPFQYPGWLTVGDFNGDGMPDIAVTRVQDGHSVNILFNEGQTLAATGNTIEVGVGQDFAAIVASFHDTSPDPGHANDYSATVDWGDGSLQSTGGIEARGTGSYEVAASHSYAAPGTYTITITIVDLRSPGRSATAMGSAQVDGGDLPSGNGWSALAVALAPSNHNRHS